MWSPSPKNKSSTGLCKNKKSVMIVEGKRTPKKSSKRVLKESKYRGDSDVSNAEPTVASKEGETTLVKQVVGFKLDTRKDDSQGKVADGVTWDLTDLEESDEEASDSRGKRVEVTEESLNHSEESHGEAKSNSNGEVSIDACKGDFHEERKVEDLNEALREEANENISDSKGGQDAEFGNTNTEQEKCQIESSNPSDNGEAEFSDDEPLNNWRHKINKTSAMRPRQAHLRP